MTTIGYKHTQVGYITLAALATASAAIYLTRGSGKGSAVILPLLVILLVCAFLFASLTIEIDSQYLSWRFGPGLIRKRVRLADIEHAEVVRNHWLYGWGIHRTPSGWLYNVSGMMAVQIRLKDGKQFRLGSDEPERLILALMQMLPELSSVYNK